MNPLSSSTPRSHWEPPSLAQMQALLPGFQFISLVGRGGMGVVFKAMQLSLNRPVAIKVLPATLMGESDGNFAARFRQESLTMAQLTHPGIVGVFDSGHAGGYLYIVMEFVEGRDLARLIQAEGKLSPEMVARVLAEVCDVLHYAHERGVVHRDIKPANLLLTREGKVKVADFGLARHQQHSPSGLTKTDVAIGTPDFLAPEAWIPKAVTDRRADIYSLGVTLYQMLTGQVPRGFWEMPSSLVCTDPRFDAIIERSLQPKPDARYQSSAEMRRDLDRILAGPSKTAKPAPARRGRIAMAVAALALAAVLLVSWLRMPHALVANLGDSGPGSLRQTIAECPQGSTIRFKRRLAGGVILLTSGELGLQKNVTIDGAGLGLSISGNKASRIFRIEPHATVALHGLLLTNGFTMSDGGAIDNLGTLTLSNCVIAGNMAEKGGGIYNYYGNLTLHQCLVENNWARTSGGGVYNFNQLAVRGSVFTNNSVEGAGGAIYSRGSVNVDSSTLISNKAGFGAGVRHVGGVCVVSSTLVAGNTAVDGPGIYIAETDGTKALLRLVNCTFTGNWASGGNGGGLRSFGGTTEGTHCTIVSNTVQGLGGGVANVDGQIVFQHSIITANSALVRAGLDLAQGDPALEINIAGSFHGTNNLLKGSPHLAPLGNHGGPTWTMPPLPGSPAIDQAGTSTLTNDQRGYRRPVGIAPDLGAVEGLAPAARPHREDPAR